MPQISEMGSDLVCTAGEKVHLQSAKRLIGCHDLVTGNDLPGSRHGRRQHPHTGGLSVLFQVSGAPGIRRFRPSADDAFILLLQAAAPDQAPQSVLGLIVQRKKQHAAGMHIQPMDGTGLRIAAAPQKRRNR